MPTGNKPLYWDGLTGKEIFLHLDYFALKRTIKHTLIRGVRPKKKPECQKKKKNTLKQTNSTCALGNSRKIKNTLSQLREWWPSQTMGILQQS